MRSEKIVLDFRVMAPAEEAQGMGTLIGEDDSAVGTGALVG